MVIVGVYLKPEISDPQGKAILDALSRQGLNEVQQVRQGKQFILTFENEITPGLLNKIEQLAQDLLSNPVIEDYSIEVKNDS